MTIKIRQETLEAHLKLLGEMEEKEEASKALVREMEKDLTKAKESQEACAAQLHDPGGMTISGWYIQDSWIAPWFAYAADHRNLSGTW